MSGSGRAAAARAASRSARPRPPRASVPSRRNSRRRSGPVQDGSGMAWLPPGVFDICWILPPDGRTIAIRVARTTTRRTGCGRR